MSKKSMLCVLLALIVFAMLVLAVAGKSRFPLVNKAVAVVLLPVESGINAVVHTSDGIRGYWRALTVLQSENEQLKKDNEELRSANIAMASIYAENRKLREMLDYKELHKSQSSVAAKVIARNFGDLRDSMYIDAGADKGLRREMAVISSGALIGVIDEVYDDYAKVLLITSAKCKIGARVLRDSSRAVGITSGRSASDGKLIMEHIFRDASIQKDDIIVTSGFSGNHPEDILIGKVTAAHLDSVGLLQEAEVIPAVDIADAEQVLVITAFTPKPKFDTNTQGGQAK